MSYAEVAVNSPFAQRKTYSYSVPAGLEIQAGHAVSVPFGNQVLQGVVVKITATPAVEETRTIAGLIESVPLIAQPRLDLALWMSDYYMAPLFDCIALMLPPGFGRRHPIKPQSISFVLRKVSVAELNTALGKLPGTSIKQLAILQYMLDHSGPVTLPELRRATGSDLTAVKRLADKGLIEIRVRRLERDPLPSTGVNLTLPLVLTAEQDAVLNVIRPAVRNGTKPGEKPKVFLLHGVTGSGKTEVYLRALAEAKEQGKRGILLVPEIALTPQMIQRCLDRFPGRVAVLHSGLRPGEQFDEWNRISRGEFDVVLGPRSALFGPQPNLGLIILDEEHESAYKQYDKSPSYHARTVARELARLTGAALILGSATPDVESYFKALSGEYRLVQLAGRVTPREGAPLPKVEVVDLRRELREGNLSLFSRSLREEIGDALENGRQTILFLNRRGAASFVECRNCGTVIRCRRCDVAMSYHFADGLLICHQCNSRRKPPEFCPSCRSRNIKYVGAGTEKLEQEARLAFQEGHILRWDSDAIIGRSKNHEAIFSRFLAHKADILVGTQLVAKGLDMPGVSLVGVINADINLNLPDFRACERTFQLLSQVAGRAGRGKAPGKVIIQTYNPANYAVQAAARHDYRQFYEKEIEYRRELRNPPFSRLARLTFSHHSEERCRQETARVRQILVERIAASGAAANEVIGPAPGFYHKLRGRFRWHILLRSADPGVVLRGIELPRGWAIDIDPVGLG